MHLWDMIPELIVLDGLPPTTNASYKTGQGRFYMTAEAKAWKLATSLLVKAARLADWRDVKELLVIVTFHMTRPAQRDVDGMVKLLLDAVADGLGFNDKRVASLFVSKEKAAADSTEIRVAEWKPTCAETAQVQPAPTFALYSDPPTNCTT
jgi:Holliday junction resolvase RusA-like endonuclease